MPLTSYALKPAHPCGGCPLRVVGHGFVRGDGPLPAEIMLVGEAPGAHEAQQGKPFVGEAGKQLDRLLKRAGLPRESLRIANAICCKPPKNFLSGAPWEHQALGACFPLLMAEIEQTQPKVIVALGNIAMRRLTGLTGITRLRGWPLEGPGGIWVIPTFHPSYLLPRKGQKDTAKLTGIVALDLRKAVDIARNGFRRVRPSYQLDPPFREVELFALEYEQALRKGETPGLSVDIETPGKLMAPDEEGWTDEQFSPTILRIGFAFAPGRALSIPWQAEYQPVIRRMMQAGGRIIFWNGYAFDQPILQMNGIEIKGEVHDGMWAWHMLYSAAPRGLESVASHYAYDLGPWKHLASSEPARYNAMDADAALRIFMGVERDLRDKGMWDIYLKHVVELYPFLFEAGRRRGVCVDVAAQQELATLLRTRKRELLISAQTMVPETLKKQKVFRTTRPPEGKRTHPVPIMRTERFCSLCGKKSTPVHFTNPKGSCLGGHAVPREVPGTGWLWEPDWETLSGDELDAALAVSGFNPGSAEQMKQYATLHQHNVGIDYKTGRPQLDRKVRDRLTRVQGDAHPIYQVSQELLEIIKTDGTYVTGFTPDYKGRIYTSYTFAASTGRLTSRSVNLQNVSRGGNNRFAPAVRKTIIPSPGHLFAEADSSAIEAVMTGYFMMDPLYVELARAGIHDYVTCLEFGIPWEEGRKKLKELRKDPAYADARERNKRIVHGSNYGMSPNMMVKSYPAHFRSSRMAAQAQARYFEACPRLPQWHHEVRAQAHRQSYLVNPWGYRHYFYEVWRVGAGGAIEPGGDANRAIAFLPQSSAAAFMRDSLLLLAQSEWGRYAPANVSIHDSICLDLPEEKVGEGVDFLLDLLSRPIPEMGGLRIGAECKVGPNWRDMHVVKIRRIDGGEHAKDA